MSRVLRVLWAALALALMLNSRAGAHEVRPAFLEIDQDGPRHFAVTWKQPVMGDIAIRLIPHVSNGWLEQAPKEQFASPGFLIRTWSIAAGPEALAGRALSVEGLERTITDVLVRVQLADGRHIETILRPDRPTTELTFARADGLPVPAYLILGVQHILTGIDHLMFVLGLLLLVGVRWRLVKAITAFTLAHSLTLAASAIGLVHVPSAVVEALVALSIVFVAAELANLANLGGGQAGLTQRHPWLIAFTFGLLHGFAFAGALAEVGLPKAAIPASLFLFNVGVEIGQLLFVGAAILVILVLRPIRRRLPGALAALGPRLPPYAIGSFAAFWFIERAVVAFS
jgi:hypothetical protein